MAGNSTIVLAPGPYNAVAPQMSISLLEEKLWAASKSQDLFHSRLQKKTKAVVMQ